MIAVVFEVEPTADGRADYLATAAALLPQLQAIDGFVSVERFQRLARPGKLLSLSFWRDEAAARALAGQAFVAHRYGTANVGHIAGTRLAEIARIRTAVPGAATSPATATTSGRAPS